MIDSDRPARLQQLESALASGQVHTVAVTPGLDPTASGSTFQDLYWRQGLFRYHAEVVMRTPDAVGQTSQQSGVEVRSGYDIAAEFSRFKPAVKTVPIARTHSSFQVHGWVLPEWLGLIGLTAAVGTLAVLVSGPQPWRATRWAWFWLITNPVGAVLFLILTGPTPPLRSPRNLKRRLTGPRAFLLVLVLAPILHHW